MHYRRGRGWLRHCEGTAREDTGTTGDALKPVVKTARKSVPGFQIKKALTSLSGVRAFNSTGDFVIGRTSINDFINAAGIDTSSPAIAQMVCNLLRETGLELLPNGRGRQTAHPCGYGSQPGRILPPACPRASVPRAWRPQRGDIRPGQCCAAARARPCIGNPEFRCVIRS